MKKIIEYYSVMQIGPEGFDNLVNMYIGAGWHPYYRPNVILLWDGRLQFVQTMVKFKDDATHSGEECPMQ